MPHAGLRGGGAEKLTFQQITHPDDLNSDLQQLERLIAGEILTYTRRSTISAKMARSSARLTVSMVRDAQLHPLYFIAQIVDISELKQSEQVNQRLMERITLANEAAASACGSGTC